jgi:excisionase family DNA binding protein
MQTKAEVAAHLRVSERTIERWMALGLPFSKPYESGSVRFRASEVDAWFASER